MGRPRSYDEGAVLSGAMHAFRRKGFQAVSIRELEDATGLKLGSLYNSYGDKAGLFAAAFAHYNKKFLQARLDRLASPEAGIAGLRALFLSLLREPNGEAFGCLITNTAVELGQRDPKPPGIDDGLSTLRGAFAERLKAARTAGALPARTDPELGALRLLALYQGILVLVRAGCARAELERLVLNEFTSLEKTDDA